MEHIFVTQRSWKSIGGLPGLSLTVQDAGVSNITLHGPEKLSDVFRAMRKFVVLKHLKVEARECNENTFLRGYDFESKLFATLVSIPMQFITSITYSIK